MLASSISTKSRALTNILQPESPTGFFSTAKVVQDLP